MAKVSININGRKYALGCDDGEEERLMRLGQKLDERISMLANQFGQIGDLRLLVMAGITLTDEAEELRENVEAEAEKIAGVYRKEAETTALSAQRTEVKAADSLLDAAKRIEKLAERLAED